MLASTITSMMDNINMSKSSLSQEDSPNPQDPTTVFPDNRRAPPLDSGHYKKLLTFGLSNMRSDNQNSMNFSSRNN